VKVLDLFSGIGGFSIGLEKAGFETVAFCEIEPYCRGVLERHWPDTPIYGDVKQLTGEQLRADGIVPDVLVGGYPCQPFSVAGRQRGEKDPRHLWPEVHRLVRELRPRWVICENVSGHIKLGLDEVLVTLEAEGYTVWPFIIPACSVDAPHKRDRVWIVAHSDSGANGRTSRQDERADGQVSKRNNGGVVDQPSEIRATDVADTDSDDWRNGSGTEPQRRQSRMEHGGSSNGQPVGQPNQDVAEHAGERLQGRTEEQVYGVGDLSQQFDGGSTDFRDGWPTEPDVGRVVNGLPNRSHRIKALGNAVVPQIPESIGLTIMQYEGKYYNGYYKHST
jgi:DNA (cytosine-5)-methyltransferase 1